MVNTETIISEIEHRFPSFEIDQESRELLTVIGGDFKRFIISNLENNTPEIPKIVSFVNELFKSSRVDAGIGPFLSEIILGLYDSEDKSNYLHLYKLLSVETRNYFDYSLSLWLRGNGLAEILYVDNIN